MRRTRGRLYKTLFNATPEGGGPLSRPKNGDSEFCFPIMMTLTVLWRSSVISLKEYRALPIDREVYRAVDRTMYWDVDRDVYRDVHWNVYLALFDVVERAVDDAVNGAVYGAVDEAFQRGFSRD